jgi:hypothetical protein
MTDERDELGRSKNGIAVAADAYRMTGDLWLLRGILCAGTPVTLSPAEAAGLYAWIANPIKLPQGGAPWRRLDIVYVAAEAHAEWLRQTHGLTYAQAHKEAAEAFACFGVTEERLHRRYKKQRNKAPHKKL